jgi:hypothetical protein
MSCPEMSYVSCELGHEIEVAGLPRRAFAPPLLKGISDGLVVSEDDEMARFRHVTETSRPHSLLSQLSIIRTVFLPDLAEFLGDGGGLYGVVDMMLQHGTHGGSGSVSDECKWCGWVGAGENDMGRSLSGSSVGKKSRVGIQHVREAAD